MKTVWRKQAFSRCTYRLLEPIAALFSPSFPNCSTSLPYFRRAKKCLGLFDDGMFAFQSSSSQLFFNLQLLYFLYKKSIFFIFYLVYFIKITVTWEKKLFFWTLLTSQFFFSFCEEGGGGSCHHPLAVGKVWPSFKKSKHASKKWWRCKALSRFQVS